MTPRVPIPPRGDKIVFASNRNVYASPPNADEREIFKRDKSYFNDIFLMNSDGTAVEQLTRSAGYDGGPFSIARVIIFAGGGFRQAGTRPKSSQ